MRNERIDDHGSKATYNLPTPQTSVLRYQLGAIWANFVKTNPPLADVTPEGDRFDVDLLSQSPILQCPEHQMVTL